MTNAGRGAKHWMILHITSRADWENAQRRGVYEAPSLATEGFIHCSTASQTVETANRFYRGQRDLVLLLIDESAVSAVVRYERAADPDAPGRADDRDDAGGGFPHIYGPLNVNAVVDSYDFAPNADGLFSLPKSLETV